MSLIAVSCLAAGAVLAQPTHDLLQKAGHVVDGKSRLSAVRDVAIRDGKIAETVLNIPPRARAAHSTGPGCSKFLDWQPAGSC